MAKRQKKGIDIIHDKSAYKSIAFTHQERERLGLRGLLPYKVATQEELIIRVMEALGRQ
jgi:malate dehydrogenase (oxaloacetate-decarboxylating)(NADP+)